MEQISPQIPSLASNAVDVNRLVQQVLEGLDKDGYIHIKEKLSDYSFQKISKQLGKIRGRSDLRVDPKKNQAQEK